MTKMPTGFKYQKQVWSLAGTVGVLLASYMILVGMTIYNTLQTQRAEKQISSITADLNEMEFSYLAIKSKVNNDLAKSMGFVEPSTIIVAKREAPTTAFVREDKI